MDNFDIAWKKLFPQILSKLVVSDAPDFLKVTKFVAHFFTIIFGKL